MTFTIEDLRLLVPHNHLSESSSSPQLYGNVSYVAPGPALDASEAALID